MKKLILKILSQKKFGLTIIAAFLVMIAMSIYLVNGVRDNVEKMSEIAGETVTYFPSYPPINTANKNIELIKRGEYLAKAGDCMACHTNTPEKQKAKPMAGGLPMYTPFGTIYTPNITPDRETGIGRWTEEQFIKAMRQGISPEGHYYYPAFPYLYFSKISTEDLKAIKAYLDSIPAVHQKNMKNDMLFPFNWRFLQLGWRILFFKGEDTDVYKNNPEQSNTWNRGAYLAEGLGHCAMCHSPSYHILANENLPLGAPVRQYDLTGAKIQGFLAPNITHANLEKVPLSEIVEVFTKDRLIGGGKIEGPMLEVNHNSLVHLTPEDLDALATYLKAVQSQAPPKPKPGSGGIGKSIYDTYCSGCHASGAGGAPKFGDPSTWENVLKQSVNKTYDNAIKGVGGMPAKGTCLSCSDDEIKQTVDYMLASLKGKSIASVTKPKPLTIEQGKRVYEQNCSICHNVGFKGALKPGDKKAWKPIVDAGFLSAYDDIMTGKKGHPTRGACPTCSDAEVKAALKYMLQTSSTGKDFSLW